MKSSGVSIQKCLTRLLLSFTLVLQSQAYAGKLQELTPALGAFEESQIKKMALDQTMNLLIQQANLHKEPSSFVNFFGQKLSEEARMAAELILLATTSEAGFQFVREGDSLVIREEGADYHMKVVDPDQMQFRLNGDVVAIDPNKDLDSQIDLFYLRAEMKERYQNKHFIWMNYFMPRAEAFYGILIREGVALAAAVLIKKGGAKALQSLSVSARKNLLKTALETAKKVGAAPFKAAAKSAKGLTEKQWFRETLRGSLFGVGFNEVYLATKLQACALGYNMGEKYIKTGTCAPYVAANPDAEEKSPGEKKATASKKKSVATVSKPSVRKAALSGSKKSAKGKAVAETHKASKPPTSNALAPVALKCNYESQPPQAEVSLMRSESNDLVFQTVTFNPSTGAVMESEASGIELQKPLSAPDVKSLSAFPHMVAEVCMSSRPQATGISSSEPERPVISKVSDSKEPSADTKSAVGEK